MGYIQNRLFLVVQKSRLSRLFAIHAQMCIGQLDEIMPELRTVDNYIAKIIDTYIFLLKVNFRTIPSGRRIPFKLILISSSFDRVSTNLKSRIYKAFCKK